MQEKSKLEKYVLGMPPLVYLILLFLIPTILMVFVAFREPGTYGGVMPLVDSSGGNIHLNITLDSFKYALTNKFIWVLFLRSMTISMLVTVLCLIIAYPLALLIASSPKKYRDFLLLLVILDNLVLKCQRVNHF